MAGSGQHPGIEGSRRGSPRTQPVYDGGGDRLVGIGGDHEDAGTQARKDAAGGQLRAAQLGGLHDEVVRPVFGMQKPPRRVVAVQFGGNVAFPDDGFEGRDPGSEGEVLAAVMKAGANSTRRGAAKAAATAAASRPPIECPTTWTVPYRARRSMYASKALRAQSIASVFKKSDRQVPCPG